MKHLLYLLFIVPLLLSCEKSDPEIPNEEELITTLIYQLTPKDGGEMVEFSFRDLDGDGGDNPEIIRADLAANTVYEATIQVLNESESPAVDITEEVIEEAEDHQFFVSSNLPGVTISYTDSDSNGLPLGVEHELTTGGLGQGSLTITLRHNPIKDNPGVAEGDISNAGGETDIEVNFILLVF